MRDRVVGEYLCFKCASSPNSIPGAAVPDTQAKISVSGVYGSRHCPSRTTDQTEGILPSINRPSTDVHTLRGGCPWVEVGTFQNKPS